MMVRYTPRARRDLVSILTYLAERSPQGAINFLAENPLGGIRTQRHALFVKVVPDHAYKVFYRPAADRIEIVHIRHALRKPWPI